MMISMRKVAKPCLSKRISTAVDQSCLNEFNHMTRVYKINRSALIRELIEEWCTSKRQIAGVSPMTQPHYELANDRALIIEN